MKLIIRALCSQDTLEKLKVFINQYHTNVTVWSPEEKLLQVEYAMESVKKGSACIGLRSEKAIVLGALNRSVAGFSAHQKKLFEIYNYMIVGIAGMTMNAQTNHMVTNPNKNTSIIP